jgi:hypothetical protein
VGRVVIEPFGIALGKLRDLKLRAPRADLQIMRLVQRQEVSQRPLDDAQAVAGQVHVADDFRVQQRHGVGRHRVAKARVELLGHRRAADHAALLQHRHLQSGARQVPGTDQAIVAASDDDCVNHGFLPGMSNIHV